VPDRVLFITNHRLGDAILSTGVLGHLVDAHPDARFTVVCGPVAAPVFEAMPRLERVIALRKRAFSMHWLDFWRQCVGTRWKLVVDLRRAPVSRLLLTRRHIGRFRPAQDPERPTLHRVEEHAALLGLKTPPPPRLWLAETDLEAGAAATAGEGNILAIAPTANWRGKQWPAERFSELALRLTAPGSGALAGARIAVLGAADERKQAEAVLGALPAERRIDLVGRLELRALAAALARCRLFVGNDSGLMHLAAAAGAPTLGLFGPGTPQLYAPWGERTAFVTSRQTREELIEAPGYNSKTTGTLMKGLPVEDALEAAVSLVEATRCIVDAETGAGVRDASQSRARSA